MGVKRKLQRDRLRAEGRLKHRGKGKCKVCGSFGCACTPKIDPPSMSDIPQMDDGLVMTLVAVEAALLARRKRKERGGVQ